MALRMPAEWAPHERTLMAWPCRRELWGDALEPARRDHAAVAAAIASFEPLTMVVNPGEQAADARRRLPGEVELLELAIDDSWLRDSGPLFAFDEHGARVGVHFRFNGWGERYTPYDRDEAAGGVLARRYGDAVREAPLVLEGGSIAVDGEGTLIATEQCLLHPSRNPSMTRGQIEDSLREQLGAERVVWLGEGLVEDRDTDGHVDLVAAFTRPGEVLLLSVAASDPNFERLEGNRARLEAAGLAVRRLPVLPRVEVCGDPVAVSPMNLYLCNGAVIAPLAGHDSDAEALCVLAEAYPDREVVGVPGAVLAYGGGGPHCITQQVPARWPA